METYKYTVSVEGAVEYHAFADCAVKAAEYAVERAYEDGLVTDHDFPVTAQIEGHYPIEVDMDIVMIFKGKGVNPLT